VAGLLEWLTSLPVAGLYASLALVAAIENVFPPFPADTVVAFGAFLAARGHGTALGAFVATWLGNIAGAMLMYALGRRFGADWLHRRFHSKREQGSEGRLERMYGKYGLAALFVSRFLPGARAIVPPFAGALRLPPLRTALVMGAASGIWYALVTYVAFGLGANWEDVASRIQQWQRYIGVSATVVVAVAGAIIGVLLWRRRRGR
jgi:membrane protein DedA with SNARE-associated domain